MKTETELKQEFIEWLQESPLKNDKTALVIMLDQLLADLEQGKWKKYPENTPENGTAYLVQRKNNKILITSSVYTYWSRLEIIAFRELPEHYSRT